jgi:hypothetical protein
MGAATRALNHT